MEQQALQQHDPGKPTSNQGPSSSNRLVSTRLPVKVSEPVVQREGFKVTSRFKNVEEKTKIDEGEMKNYFEFLEPLSLSQDSPWTDSEIVEEYYSSRNWNPDKIKNLDEKIASFHSKIVDAEEIQLTSRVMMLYFTQTSSFKLFIKRSWKNSPLQSLDKDTEWRLIRVKISNSSSKEIFVERERQYIVSLNEAKEINPLPWATTEVKHLLELVYSETGAAESFLDLSDICEKFKESSASRRSVEQLVAKAEQHLQASSFSIIKEAHKKWMALYRLQTSLCYQFLRNCPEKLIYQENQQNQLVYLKTPVFLIGTFDEHTSYNASPMLTDILKFVQNVSVSRLTGYSDDDCASLYENEHSAQFLPRQYTVKCINDAYWLVELDDRSNMFHKTHTIILNSTSVSQEFQTRANKYNACSFENGILTGYTAQNVLVQFNSDGRCSMEKEDVLSNCQRVYKTEKTENPLNTLLDKDSNSLLECLLRILGVELCRLPMDKLHAHCEKFGFSSNKMSQFMAILNKLKPQIESLDHLGVFTQLRLLFLTSTPASNDFKKKTKHYEVTWSENGYALKFKAFVNLTMICKPGELYGILNDITLARANNEYVEEDEQPIQEEGESSSNAPVPYFGSDDSSDEEYEEFFIDDRPNPIVRRDAAYVDDYPRPENDADEDKADVSGDQLEHQNDNPDHDEHFGVPEDSNQEQVDSPESVRGNEDSADAEMQIEKSQENDHQEDIELDFPPEYDADEDETDVPGDQCEHQNDHSDYPDSDYDVPEQDEQPIQEKGEHPVPYIGRFVEEYEEDLINELPNPIVQRDAAHVDDDPRPENDDDQEKADVSGNQLEYLTDNSNGLDSDYDVPEQFKPKPVVSRQSPFGSADSLADELANIGKGYRSNEENEEEDRRPANDSDEDEADVLLERQNDDSDDPDSDYEIPENFLQKRPRSVDWFDVVLANTPADYWLEEDSEDDESEQGESPSGEPVEVIDLDSDDANDAMQPALEPEQEVEAMITEQQLFEGFKTALSRAEKSKRFLNLRDIIQDIKMKNPKVSESVIEIRILREFDTFEDSGLLTSLAKVLLIYMYEVYLDKEEQNMVTKFGEKVEFSDAGELMQFSSKDKKINLGVPYKEPILDYLKELTKTSRSAVPREKLARDFLNWRQKNGENTPIHSEYLIDRFKHVFGSLNSQTDIDNGTKVKMHWIAGTKLGKNFKRCLERSGTVEILNGKVQKYQDARVKLDYTEWCERPEQNEDTTQEANPEEMEMVWKTTSRKRVHWEESFEANLAKRSNYNSSKSSEPSPRESSDDQPSVSHLNASSLDSVPDHPLSTISTLEFLKTIVDCMSRTHKFKSVVKQIKREMTTMKDDKMAVDDVLSTLDLNFQWFTRTASITEDREDTVPLFSVLKVFEEIAKKFKNNRGIGQLFKRITEKIEKLSGRERIPISEVRLVLDVWRSLCAKSVSRVMPTKQSSGSQITPAEQPSTNVAMPTRQLLLNWLQGFVKLITPRTSDDILNEIQAHLEQEETSRIKIEANDLLSAFQLGFQLVTSALSTENDRENSVHLTRVLVLFEYILMQLELPIMASLEEDIRKFDEMHDWPYRICNRAMNMIEKSFLISFTLQPLEP